MAKKEEKKQFFIKDKEVITDPTAPVISNEFIDKREDGDYTGQTIEVQSETHLDDDRGTGEAVILRTYEFGANPLAFRDAMPQPQEVFNYHYKAIMGMLWQDGLRPAEDIEPRLIFSKDRTKYLIMVGARPGLGQTLLAKPQTLTEIINASRPDRNKVQRSVSIPPTKKRKTGSAA